MSFSILSRNKKRALSIVESAGGPPHPILFTPKGAPSKPPLGRGFSSPSDYAIHFQAPSNFGTWPTLRPEAIRRNKCPPMPYSFVKRRNLAKLDEYKELVPASFEK